MAALTILGERLSAALNLDGTDDTDSSALLAHAQAGRQSEAPVLTDGGRAVRHVHTQWEPRRAWEIRLPRPAARPGVVQWGLLGVAPDGLAGGRDAQPEVGSVIGPQSIRWSNDLRTVSLSFSIPTGGEVVLVYDPTPENANDTGCEQ